MKTFDFEVEFISSFVLSYFIIDWLKLTLNEASEHL